MLFQTEAGDGAFLRRAPKRPKLRTGDEARGFRNALWLHATTRGLIDPIQGKIRRHSISELGRLWGLTPQAVRLGIKQAVADREFMAAVQRRDEA